MPIAMKAIRDFRGQPGEGVDRFVRAGREIKVIGQGRAHYLEVAGLAVPIREMPKMPAEVRSDIPPPENRAAETGPLLSAGGETGGGRPALSSPAVPQRVTRRLLRRGVEPKS